MDHEIDAAAFLRETISDWAERYPDFRAEIRMWHDRWDELAAPRFDGSIRVQRAWRTKVVPVFALTGFGRHGFEVAVSKLGFLQDFDCTYV